MILREPCEIPNYSANASAEFMRLAMIICVSERASLPPEFSLTLAKKVHDRCYAQLPFPIVPGDAAA